MKALSNTIAAPAVKGEVKGDVETIRPLADIVSDFEVTDGGERVVIRKGAKLSPSEFALFIADRENTGNRYKTQARFAFYEAGQLPNGSEVQVEIVKRLEGMLSRSALYQLKSEANTIVPLMLTEGIKVPLTTVKDAMAELEVNEKTGRLLPLSKQSKAGRKLIPLLKEGAVTQAKVREIRNENKPRATSTPSAGNGKGADDETLAYAGILASLNRVNTYLDKNKVEGNDRQALVNAFTDIGRKLGVSVVVPSLPSAPAKVAASVPAKK